jgi:hypothetical protein
MDNTYEMERPTTRQYPVLLNPLSDSVHNTQLVGIMTERHMTQSDCYTPGRTLTANNQAVPKGEVTV